MEIRQEEDLHAMKRGRKGRKEQALARGEEELWFNKTGIDPNDRGYAQPIKKPLKP